MLFRSDGIKINWNNMGTSPQAARAMGSGSLDIAGNMNTAALLMLNSEGLPVRVVTGTAHPTSNFAIVSKPGTELSVRDLKGKQVVGPKGTFFHPLQRFCVYLIDTFDDVQMFFDKLFGSRHHKSGFHQSFCIDDGITNSVRN